MSLVKKHVFEDGDKGYYPKLCPVCGYAIKLLNVCQVFFSYKTEFL